MKVIPKYTKEGVLFNGLTPGTPFWWVDHLLIKIDSLGADGINAVSLHNGMVFTLDYDKVVIPANVKVVEKE